VTTENKSFIERKPFPFILVMLETLADKAGKEAVSVKAIQKRIFSLLHQDILAAVRFMTTQDL